jgi:hypothetical protein
MATQRESDERRDEPTKRGVQRARPTRSRPHFSISLSHRALAMLDEISDAWGSSRSGMVERLIRERHRRGRPWLEKTTRAAEEAEATEATAEGEPPAPANRPGSSRESPRGGHGARGAGWSPWRRRAGPAAVRAAGRWSPAGWSSVAAIRAQNGRSRPGCRRGRYPHSGRTLPASFSRLFAGSPSLRSAAPRNQAVQVGPGLGGAWTGGRYLGFLSVAQW